MRSRSAKLVDRKKNQRHGSLIMILELGLAFLAESYEAL
jgi:hypothetical protein